MKAIRPTYRILAAIMALLMFLTSANLPVDLHFCQGKLKTFSFFGKAKNCHEMEKASAACPHHQKMAAATSGCAESEDDNCCQHRTIILDTDEDQPLTINKFTVSEQTQQFAVAFINTFFINVFVEKNTPPATCYKPPLIPRDVRVLFQSFLL